MWTRVGIAPHPSPESFVSLVCAELRLHRWVREHRLGHVHSEPWGVPLYVCLSGNVIKRVRMLPGDTFLGVFSISLRVGKIPRLAFMLLFRQGSEPSLQVFGAETRRKSLLKGFE